MMIDKYRDLARDFDIHTDNLVSARRPDFIVINPPKEGNLQNCRLCCTDWAQNKTERKWKEGEVPRPCQVIKTPMEHEGDDYTNRDWCIRHSNYRTIKGIGGIGSSRTSGDCRNYTIVENGQNTEKSPGDLRRLAVTQTPVKDHQLILI